MNDVVTKQNMSKRAQFLKLLDVAWNVAMDLRENDPARGTVLSALKRATEVLEGM